jgi:hypothetical protein
MATDLEEAEIQRTLGEFLWKYQALESELGEIWWFCVGVLGDRRSTGHGRARLLQAAESSVPAALASIGCIRSKALQVRFTHAFRRCRKLPKRRNELVHGMFTRHESFNDSPVFVLQTTRNNGVATIGVQYEAFSAGALQTLLAELGSIHTDLFQLHRELMYTFDWTLRPAAIANMQPDTHNSVVHAS